MQFIHNILSDIEQYVQSYPSNTSTQSSSSSNQSSDNIQKLNNLFELAGISSTDKLRFIENHLLNRYCYTVGFDPTGGRSNAFVSLEAAANHDLMDLHEYLYILAKSFIKQERFRVRLNRQMLKVYLINPIRMRSSVHRNNGGSRVQSNLDNDVMVPSTNSLALQEAKSSFALSRPASTADVIASADNDSSQNRDQEVESVMDKSVGQRSLASSQHHGNSHATADLAVPENYHSNMSRNVSGISFSSIMSTSHQIGFVTDLSSNSLVRANSNIIATNITINENEPNAGVVGEGGLYYEDEFEELSNTDVTVNTSAPDSKPFQMSPLDFPNNLVSQITDSVPTMVQIDETNEIVEQPAQMTALIESPRSAISDLESTPRDPENHSYRLSNAGQLTAGKRDSSLVLLRLGTENSMYSKYDEKAQINSNTSHVSMTSQASIGSSVEGKSIRVTSLMPYL